MTGVANAGVVAALGQALIPFYTGRIIDYASIDPDVSQFEHTFCAARPSFAGLLHFHRRARRCAKAAAVRVCCASIARHA